jgi:hypothetical protein
MGKIITISPRLAVPTQNLLSAADFRLYLEEFNKKGSSALDYIPVQECNGKYYLLDGHHRMAVAFLANTRIRVFLPRNKEDLMQESEFPGVSSADIFYMNDNIERRFEDVIDFANTVSADYGINNMGDLIRKQVRRGDLDKIWEEVLHLPFPNQYLLQQIK